MMRTEVAFPLTLPIAWVLVQTHKLSAGVFRMRLSKPNADRQRSRKLKLASCVSNYFLSTLLLFRIILYSSLDIIPKDDQTDYDEFWFCVEFQGYKTKKFDDGKDSLITRYLAVDGEGGAAAFIDTRQFNSCDDLDHPYYIPNQQTDLTSKSVEESVTSVLTSSVY